MHPELLLGLAAALLPALTLLRARQRRRGLALGAVPGGVPHIERVAGAPGGRLVYLTVRANAAGGTLGAQDA